MSIGEKIIQSAICSFTAAILSPDRETNGAEKSQAEPHQAGRFHPDPPPAPKPPPRPRLRRRGKAFTGSGFIRCGFIGRGLAGRGLVGRGLVTEVAGNVGVWVFMGDKPFSHYH